MSIAETKNDVAVITLDVFPSKGKASEVAKAATGKGVFLFLDFKTSATDSLAGQLNQVVVRDRSVTMSGLRSLNTSESIAANFIFSHNKHNGRILILESD
jgi:hypothetical protein